MRIQEIYTAFMGEQNKYGIGAPAIFLRSAGCHLRCYKHTKGILCDTPLALEKDSGKEYSLFDLFHELNTLRRETGINLICFTGGDPLWRSPEQLDEFFAYTKYECYNVVVETSGTLDWTPFTKYDNISWVIDHKLPSAGLKASSLVYLKAGTLTSGDYIKFVVDTEEDIEETLRYIDELKHRTKAIFAVGPYWGSNTFSVADLFKRLAALGSFNQEVYNAPKIVMNVQLHKFVAVGEELPTIVFKTKIPEGI